MKALLDTQVVLWFMLNDPKLSAHSLWGDLRSVKRMFREPCKSLGAGNQDNIGKLRINDDFQVLWDDVQHRFQTLPIQAIHSARLLSMPFHHKDPFGRMLVARR